MLVDRTVSVRYDGLLISYERRKNVGIDVPRPIKRARGVQPNALLRGDRSIPRTGSMPRVKKKFQCTPYSVTCSCSSAGHGGAKGS